MEYFFNLFTFILCESFVLSCVSYRQHMRGYSSNGLYVLKKCVYFLTCLNFSFLWIILHLMQYTYEDFFPLLLKTIFELIDFDAFSTLPFFVSPFPYQQSVSLWGKLKEVTQGKIKWIGRVGHGSHAMFGQKLLNTQHGMGRCAHISPIMKWVNTFKESSKKFTEAEHSLSQPWQLVY